MRFQSHGPQDTCRLAAHLAAVLASGDFIALEGDLGAGKTCFAQGLCHALGYQDGVRSPTFVLLQQYAVGGTVGVVHHFDLYRLDLPEQLDDLGYEEYFYGDGVCVVEWAERAGDRLPAERLAVRLEVGPSAEERTITLTAFGERASRLVSRLEGAIA